MDASYEIGSGHVMRCLTLAEALKNRSVSVCFICRDLEGQLIDLIQSKGFKVHLLLLPTGHGSFMGDRCSLKHASWLGVDQETDALETLEILSNKKDLTWLVVDHYGIDYQWHSRVRKSGAKIFVLDDLADRKHDCDLLLDQSYFGNDLERYRKLTPKTCKTLIGPRYSLLRPEFDNNLRANLVRSYALSRIFVNYGGVDKLGMTTKTLELLFPILPSHILIDVVVGEKNVELPDIKKICKASNINLYVNTTEIAKLMANADLAIGCGGVVALERAFWCLPTFAISTALNQQETLRDMAATGVVTLMESLTELPSLIASALTKPPKQIEPPVHNGTQKVVEQMYKSMSGISGYVDRIKR